MTKDEEEEVTPCGMHLPTGNGAPGTLHGQTPYRPGTQTSIADPPRRLAEGAPQAIVTAAAAAALLQYAIELAHWIGH